MQQTLSAAVEHDLSEVFALHFRLYPLHTLDDLSKPSIRRSSCIWAYNSTTETSRPSTVELEDPESEVGDWGAAGVDLT